MTAPHPSNVSGRPINPDTEQPIPSASAAQEQLADELYARLLDADPLGEWLPTGVASIVRDALVEVAVRQHGRTLRACIAEVRDRADRLDLDARRAAQDALDSSPAPAVSLREAVRFTEAASTLRSVAVFGFRA